MQDLYDFSPFGNFSDEIMPIAEVNKIRRALNNYFHEQSLGLNLALVHVPPTLEARVSREMSIWRDRCSELRLKLKKLKDARLKKDDQVDHVRFNLGIAKQRYSETCSELALARTHYEQQIDSIRKSTQQLTHGGLVNFYTNPLYRSANTQSYINKMSPVIVRNSVDLSIAKRDVWSTNGAIELWNSRKLKVYKILKIRIK